MSTTDWEVEPDIDDELAEESAYEPYRALSKAALFAFVLALLAPLSLMFPVLLVLPLIGLILGIIGRRNVARYPEELSGQGLAWVGLLGCALILIGGISMHIYVYATEVPDGYTRISFAQLQPKENLPGTQQPALPMELDGKKVFVKGYVHPGVSSTGRISKFILVPDMGTCCFGGQPKLTDMIEVSLGDLPGIRYSTRRRKLAGVLRVSPRVRQVAGGLQGGFYELTADYVK